MDKKIWLKVLISILIVMIVIIVIVLYFLNQEYVEQKYSEFTNQPEEVEENVKEEVNSELKIVQDRDMFYTVTNCVQMYLNYLVDKDSNIIYNFIYNEYREKYDINEQNVLSKLGTYNNYQVFRPKKMYQMDQNQSITTFFVYGTIREEIPARETSITERKETDIYIAIKIDYGETTYTVIPNGYISSDIIDYSTQMDNLEIEMKEYTNYIDKCEIIMEIRNNAKNAININELDMELEYNEDEETSEIINEEKQIVGVGETKKIKLIFENNFKTPKQIIINDKEKGSETVIPVIKGSNNNN